MKHILNFIPQKVRHLRDWADFVLKSVFDQFVEDTETALDSKLDQEDGDARYGRLGAANTWSATQTFNSAPIISGNTTTDIAGVLQSKISIGTRAGLLGRIQLGNSIDGLEINPAFGGVLAHFGQNNTSYLRHKTGVGTTSPGSMFHVVNGTASQPVQTLQGAGSQSAPLQKFQLVSSTATVRDAAAIDVIWMDNTDATRTSAVSIHTVTNGGALTEVLRLDAGGITLKDRTSGDSYRLYVDGGAIAIEAI